MTQQMIEDIRQAAAIVRKGGVIVYPTDTIWGIGCDASNPRAVRRVYEIKQRADAKALIVLLGDERLLDRYVENVPEPARQIIELAERPTTIIFDHGFNVAPEVLSEDGSVAIRVTREEFSRELCRACGRPLVSTSANISGQPSASCFAEISKEILDAVDYVCVSRRDEPGGNCASSIIKVGDDLSFKIIRP